MSKDTKEFLLIREMAVDRNLDCFVPFALKAEDGKVVAIKDSQSGNEIGQGILHYKKGKGLFLEVDKEIANRTFFAPALAYHLIHQIKLVASLTVVHVQSNATGLDDQHVVKGQGIYIKTGFGPMIEASEINEVLLKEKNFEAVRKFVQQGGGNNAHETI